MLTHTTTVKRNSNVPNFCLRCGLAFSRGEEFSLHLVNTFSMQLAEGIYSTSTLNIIYPPPCVEQNCFDNWGMYDINELRSNQSVNLTNRRPAA